MANEICERDQVNPTAALFFESTARVVVSVGREDDVKFVGLCEARGIPILGICVADASGQLEVQDLTTWNIEELKNSNCLVRSLKGIHSRITVAIHPEKPLLLPRNVRHYWHTKNIGK